MELNLRRARMSRTNPNPYDIPALIEQLEQEKVRKATMTRAIELQNEITRTAQENKALDAQHVEIAKQKRLQEAYELARERGLLYREMCRHVDTPTGCAKGDLCTYAHTQAQLCQKQNSTHDPSRLGTRICHEWVATRGSCSRGNRCWFAHPEQLQPPPPRTLDVFLPPYLRGNTASGLDESQSSVFDNYDTY